jgi:hypothetical protein
MFRRSSTTPFAKLPTKTVTTKRAPPENREIDCFESGLISMHRSDQGAKIHRSRRDQMRMDVPIPGISMTVRL